MPEPQEPNPLIFFLCDFENGLTRIIEANGFGKFGISIEVARNKKGEKKFALILEGQPSYRYLFNIENVNQFNEFLQDWKSKEDSDNL